MATKIPVIIICDFGLIKLGRLADFRAQLKMREILFVLTSNDAYISANPKLTYSERESERACERKRRKKK